MRKPQSRAQAGFPAGQVMFRAASVMCYETVPLVLALQGLGLVRNLQAPPADQVCWTLGAQ